MGLSDALSISSRVACKQQGCQCIGSTCLSSGVPYIRKYLLLQPC